MTFPKPRSEPPAGLGTYSGHLALCSVLFRKATQCDSEAEGAQLGSPA